MKYTIISGSTRQKSQSLKVATYIKNILTEDSVNTAFLLDLSQEVLPLWEEDCWEKGTAWNKEWHRISQQLKEADAAVIVCPEWGGMVPPALMNIFQLCNQHELSHKPALIVTVSSGVGGAYPVAELRMASYKNTKICYLPEHVIIRNVNELLNYNQRSSNKEDAYIRDRLTTSLAHLGLYAEAFIKIRNSPLIKEPKHPYGM